MTTTKPISREYRIYLALWRKAFKSDELLRVKTPNLGTAVAMRQGMYRAIRPFREGTVFDDELVKAAEKFVIYLVKADKPTKPHFIEFRERVSLKLLEQSWDELGLDEEDLLVGEERGITKSLQSLIDEGVEPALRTTPFYERS